MGVSGVGKTTIGKLLAERLQLPFYDADDFHSADNVFKMREGIPLRDEEREDWLELLAENIQKWHKKEGAVLACSALKEQYRQRLSSIPEKYITWIFLHSGYDVIYKRIADRKGHYFKPDLLQSQYDILEEPGTAVHVDVQATEEEIIEEIMEKVSSHKHNSEIGLIGLGVMGKSLALNFASKGVAISVFNRQVEGVEVDIARNFALEHKEIYDFPWFDDLEAFVRSLHRPRNLFLMVNAGKAVDMVIDSLLPFLEEGDLIIDGGNSHYKDTELREKYLAEKGLHFMGAGISGGEEGALKGPSIMPGGPAEAYERVGELLEKIAAKDKQGKACCTYIGPGGAGHFVKMLHNGIEYGEMQLIAETYHFLKFSKNLQPNEIASLFEEWNKEMQSFLLEISVDILRKKEDDEFLIDKVLDAAKQKGTGGWSTNAALELGVAFDTITAAVMARNISGKKEERVEASVLYGKFEKKGASEKLDQDGLFKAYQAASIINHAIGFELLSEASKTYDWQLNLSEIARIWTNGCIIRSAFMERLAGIFKEHSENLLMNEEISRELKENRKHLVNVVSSALQSNCSMPVMSAAANYFLSFVSAQSSANMIQAQRDSFGAHTYERTDKPRGEYFHSHWSSEDETI
ncbi:hypothetical protein GCM10010465_14210 [Actinomadura fibrosa]